jgi:predicted nuclease with TOPRIM domain
MAETPDNLIFEYLRRLDGKLDRVIDDLSDLKVRVTNLEEGLAGVNRRLDRIEVRLDRVERRLDLTEQPH